MNRQFTRVQPTASTGRGFTLVELLTVVAIIVLLIGILVPAVNKVRDKAKESSTRSTFAAIDTGLETFKGERTIGGSYPPSVSDSRGTNNQLDYDVQSPYTQLANGPTGQFEISGAGLMLWALAGADLNGCPGFKTFRSGSTYWAQDTDDDATTTQSGAYALDPTTREPKYKRVAPLIDLSRVEMTTWKSAAHGTGWTGSFEIPREVEARTTAGAEATIPRRNYPMFLDAFGGPLLYWRADPTGIQACDDTPVLNTQRTNLGIYHFRDNGSLLATGLSGEGSYQAKLVLNPRTSNISHNLRYIIPDHIPPNADTSVDPLDGFWAYIRNKAVQSRVMTHRNDTYLLISAGVDGIFGTADDIANFDHNGAELTAPTN